jgi:hypothetical protein
LQPVCVKSESVLSWPERVSGILFNHGWTQINTDRERRLTRINGNNHPGASRAYWTGLFLV